MINCRSARKGLRHTSDSSRVTTVVEHTLCGSGFALIEYESCAAMINRTEITYGIDVCYDTNVSGPRYINLQCWRRPGACIESA